MKTARVLTPSKRQELAKLLTLLDDGDSAGLDRLAAHKADGLPYLVGVTGAAGVGKSLLLSKLIGKNAAGRVGILAVDPTNPAGGGALLGDRVRMPNLPPGVFLRSVATRGGTGGLSDKLIDMAAAMKAFGYGEVYVETVGIGQDELAVRQVVDTLIVVEAPGLGDEVQAMKSSPMSVADIIVVNKSDKPGASETAAVISETIGKKPVLTSALDGEGIEKLSESIESEKQRALQKKIKIEADRRKYAWRLTHALARKWSERLSNCAPDIIRATPDGRSIYRKIQEIQYFIPDHVAVAVPDLDEAIAHYRKMGFFLERREKFSKELVEMAFFNAGGFHIELLQPMSAASPISKFVAERGGGLHHIAFEVDDLSDAVKIFKSRRIEILGEVRAGARGKQILFLHPKSGCRALLEFCACGMHPEKC